MRPLRLLAGLAMIASLACVTGCRSAYPDDMARFRNELAGGHYGEAVEIAKAGRENDPESQLVWTLELANAQRLAGDLPAAVATYEAAEARLRAIDEAPDVSLSREGLSAFSNPYQITYRGRNLDRIFASTYQALACIEAGELEKARVAMSRTMFRIEDAKRIAAERSRVEQEESAAAGAEDGDFQTRLNSDEVASARAAVQSRFMGLPTYASAMNPFAAWLHGVYFLHTAEGASDLEIARKSLQAAQAVVGANAFIAEDVALAATGTGRPDLGADKTLVYIIHESGLAPRWSEQVVTLPLIYADPRAPFVSIALPEIYPGSQRLGPVEATFGDGPRVTTVPLASVDAIVHAEFREEYPIARNRAIAAATIKSVAAYVANKAAQEYANKRDADSGAQLLMLATLMGTNVYTTASAQADLRNWSGLPQQIEIGRCVAPRGARLRLSGGSILGTYECPLPAARAVVVTIRSTAPGAPAVIRARVLQK